MISPVQPIKHYFKQGSSEVRDRIARNDELLLDPLISEHKYQLSLLFPEPFIYIIEINVAQSQPDKRSGAINYLCRFHFTIPKDTGINDTFTSKFFYSEFTSNLHQLGEQLRATIEKIPGYESNLPYLFQGEVRIVLPQEGVIVHRVPNRITNGQLLVMCNVINKYIEAIVINTVSFFDGTAEDSNDSEAHPAETTPALLLGSNKTTQKDIFICYSNLDLEIAKQLDYSLNQAGYSTWFDKRDLFVGMEWIKEIGKAILNSKFICVLLSNNFIDRGPWAKVELQQAIIKQVGNSSVILLPVLIEDCPIPSTLMTRQYADFRASFKHGLEQLISALERYTN